MTTAATAATAASAIAAETMRRHLAAITRMLLGRKMMKPGLTMAAGTLLNDGGVIRIAELAHQANRDLIHLDFAIDGDSATLREIILVMPRDRAVHVVRRCRLAQRPEDRQAVLLPDPRSRGAFRIAPDEIIHTDHLGSGLTSEGVAFASRRLAQLLRDGADVSGQIVVHDLTQ